MTTEIEKTCPDCGRYMVTVWTGEPPAPGAVYHPRVWVHHATGMEDCQ